jgi:hypothetical protein
MSNAIYPLKLPVSIKRAAAKLAKEDGVSVNQWIASAVARKGRLSRDCGGYLQALCRQG